MVTPWKSTWQQPGNIHKDNLRADRVPRMEALDVEFMQALEAGTSTTAIATEKQTLRDITDDSTNRNASDTRRFKSVGYSNSIRRVTE